MVGMITSQPVWEGNDAETCPTCGAPRPGRFCQDCGEERLDPADLTLQRFMRSEADDLPVGNHVIRTFYTLFRHPGRLTRDYLIGRRRPYMRPFQVYLLTSLVFFFMQPYTGLFGYKLELYETLPFFRDKPAQMVGQELARTHELPKGYEGRFNKVLRGQEKSMMLVMVPMVALGLIPFLRRRGVIRHIVYAVHYMAALLLWMLAVVAIFRIMFLGIRPLIKVWFDGGIFLATMLNGEWPVVAMIYVPMFYYMRRAAVETYDLSVRRAGWLSLWLVFWQMLLIVFFYRVSLFFTTFYSLKYLG